MKIKKEFIPLILSGKKKYEYRVIKKGDEFDKHGIYETNEKFYLLKYKWKFESFDNLAEHCCMHNEWESLLFVLQNKWYEDDFLKDDETFALYEWEEIKELETKELEIVE